jgi:hypothetical protein
MATSVSKQTTDDILRRKRELHLRIGRSRRRIDRRVRATKDSARQLLSWRTYVVRHPGWSLLVALGAGLSASNLLRPKRMAGWLGSAFVHQAFGGLKQQIWNELRRTWTESTPDKK